MCAKASDDIVLMDDVLIRYEGQDEYYTLPDGIRRIEDNAFYDKGRLIGLTLPDSVTEIGDYAFKICNNMVSLRLPARTERFGIGVFQQCRSLRRVDLPDGVQEIDSGMFVCCDFLETVSVPVSVGSVDPIAFATCRNLRNVYIAPEKIGILPPKQRVLAAVTYMNEADPSVREDRAVIHEYVADHAETIGRMLIENNGKTALNYMVKQDLISGAAASELIGIANRLHRTELAAMLLDRNRSGEAELFDLDPFA